MAGITVRHAREADAEHLIALVQELAAEPANNILMGPGDFTKTVEEEREFLRAMAASPNSAFIVACDGDRVIGCTDAHGGKRPATKHCAGMGISVAKAYRGQGVGKKLMQAMIDWAGEAGIQRIELNVFVRNAVAIRLYERFGFRVEGQRSKAAFKDGEYLDDFLMAKIFD